jgi:predicted ATP-grasp superfamily ATP-dependent carboligase
MRRVLVYEHLTATTPNPDPADSLWREGRAMRDAIADDLRGVPDVEVVLFPSPLGGEGVGVGGVVRDDFPVNAPVLFDSLVHSCDAVLVIAPETDGILESLVRRVEAARVHLLGPSSAAIRLTADKLALFRRWQSSGVPTPETVPLSELPPFPPPYVLKPRFGCGSANVRMTSTVPPVDSTGVLVIQPFVPGSAASVAFLIGPTGIVPLPPCFQHVSPEANFRYDGGEVPIPLALAARVVALGSRAVGCVPGLRGYVGVDLVLGPDPAGNSDAAIEINPRLTTSYVGLRALADGNVARAFLALCDGEKPAPVGWKPGRVRFRPDGTWTSGED